MRAYQKRAVNQPFIIGRTNVTPGFRLTEVIDQFYAEGVVPDFIPADLGEDSADEIDPRTGLYAVDPDGDIRTDPFEAREAKLMEGIKDPDPAPVPIPPSSVVPPTIEPIE